MHRARWRRFGSPAIRLRVAGGDESGGKIFAIDYEIAELWGIGEGEAKPSATIHELKPPKKEQPTGKPSYAALSTKDKVYGFTIVSQSPHLEYSFFYQNLLQLVVNAPEADFVSVMISSAFIRISGRNLKPIATALKLRTCDTITQYSPQFFLAPGDTTASFVAAVEVTTPDPQPVKKPERVVFPDPQGGVQ